MPNTIEDAIERARERPLSDIVNFDASELLQRRIADLNLFTLSIFPLDLAKLFEDAISLTKTCHETANNCLKVFQMSARIRPYDAPYLYILATAQIDGQLQDPKTGNKMQEEVYETTRKIHRRILVAILKSLSLSSTGETLQDIIDTTFKDSARHEQTIALFQATLIQGAKDLIVAKLEVARAVGMFALYWRYVFYRVILQDVGSNLEREAHDEEMVKTLTELSISLAAKLPVMGELAELARTLFKAARQLFDKRLALEALAKDLAAKNTMAQDYVVTYLSALLSWAPKATQINELFSDAVIEPIMEAEQLLQRAIATYSDVLPPLPLRPTDP